MTSLKTFMIWKMEKDLYACAEACFEQSKKILNGSDPFVAALRSSKEGKEIMANAWSTVANWLLGCTQEEILIQALSPRG